MKTVARILALLMILHGGQPARGDDALPLNRMDTPEPPTGFTGKNEGQDVARYSEDRLIFDKNCHYSREAAKGKSNPCDMAYATIKKRYEEFKMRKAEAANRVNGIAPGCSEGQGAGQNCQNRTTTTARDSYRDIAESEGRAADDLDGRRRAALNAEATKFKDELMANNPGVGKIAKDQLEGAITGPVITEKRDRQNLYSSCTGKFSSAAGGIGARTAATVDAFCENLTAYQEAKYYSKRLREASGASLASGDAAADAARRAAEREREGRSIPDPTKPEKSGLFGLDFKDWLGLGMLGVMAGGAYCAATGKCASKSASSVSDPTLNGNQNQYEPGATSPTPESPHTGANGVGNGDLGPGNQAGNGGSAIGNSASGTLARPPDNSVKFSVPEGDGGPAASANGVDSSHGFQSSFERNLASPFGGSYAPAGGLGANAGGGGGTLAKGGEGASAEAPAKPAAGEGAPAGNLGFSLGGPGSSSADAALKSILNGDPAPAAAAEAPTDAKLDGILDAANADPAVAAGQVQAAGAETAAADSLSIFSRVKETHVRCLKRGCVTFGIGKNI